MKIQTIDFALAVIITETENTRMTFIHNKDLILCTAYGMCTYSF
jgi:hypothetical protein